MLRQRPSSIATDRLRLLVAGGAPPDDIRSLPPRTRRALAVATAVGAPLLDALDGAQAAEDDLARSRRAVAVASAQTRSVAAGLLLAPALLVPALGRLVGADLLAFYRTPAGTLVLLAGLAMLGLGGGVIVVLVRRVGKPTSSHLLGLRGAAVLLLVSTALVGWLVGVGAALVVLLAGAVLFQRRSRDAHEEGVDEAADLAATALSGGVSVPEALRIAADELPDLAHRLRRVAFALELGGSAGAPAQERRPGSGSEADAGPRAPVLGDGLSRLVELVTTAEEVGAPIISTLRRLAGDLRADDLARVLAAAERLPAQLTFPTALCLLPGTVLLVGAPIVHAGLLAAGT